jgi:hypothetical protein
MIGCIFFYSFSFLKLIKIDSSQISIDVAANLVADVQVRSSQDVLPLVVVLGSLINLKPALEMDCTELVNKIYHDDIKIKLLIHSYALLEMN